MTITKNRRIHRHLLVLALAACAASCSKPAARAIASAPAASTDLQPAPLAPAGAPKSTLATFTCTDSLQVYAIFTTDSTGHSDVALAVNDDRLHLPQLMAASGARYGDSTAMFWNKGDSADFRMAGVARKCWVGR